MEDKKMLLSDLMQDIEHVEYNGNIDMLEAKLQQFMKILQTLRLNRIITIDDYDMLRDIIRNKIAIILNSYNVFNLI